MAEDYTVGELARRLLTSSQPTLGCDEVNDAVDTTAGFEVGKDKGSLAAHSPCIALHDIQACADQRCQIGLVDDQQIGTSDTGAALSRDFVARRNIDDVDRQVDEFG